MTTRVDALDYRANADNGVELHAFGVQRSVRVAVNRFGSTRGALVAADLLNEALRDGAAYGVVDVARDLADALAHREAPGRVWYTLTAAFEITRRVDGVTATLALPRSSKSAMVALAGELTRAFALGGEHPGAVPPARTTDRGDGGQGAALARRVAALEAGSTLLELTLAGGAVHLAVETAGGILCDCGKAGADRFVFGRVHMPKRSRQMPGLREVAKGT